jgi:hypothetical protein
MGITMLPWQSMCVAHPFGHDHYKQNGPSPCELRGVVLQQSGEHLLPLVDCEHKLDTADDFTQIQSEIIVQMVTLSVVLNYSVSFVLTEQAFLLLPDPNCRAATLLSNSPLRAPPLV